MDNISEKIEIRQLLVRMINDQEYRLEELREKLQQVDRDIFDIEEQAMMLIGSNNF